VIISTGLFLLDLDLYTVRKLQSIYNAEMKNQSMKFEYEKYQKVHRNPINSVKINSFDL